MATWTGSKATGFGNIPQAEALSMNKEYGGGGFAAAANAQPGKPPQEMRTANGGAGSSTLKATATIVSFWSAVVGEFLPQAFGVGSLRESGIHELMI